MSEVFDVAVIGGGIVGCATAMTLAQRFKRSVVVIEAAEQLAPHQSSHNSGVIHAGLYYRPGSLKSQLCIEGREAMFRFCEEENIPHRRCGKLVVAFEERELPALAELERRGAANGLDGIRRLQAAELKEYEPNVNGIAGLWVPHTGVVDYRYVTEAYARRARAHGAQINLGSRVTGVTPNGAEIVAHTTAGDVRARFIVNCGGLQSDRIARMCGAETSVRIVPFRGEYYDLSPESAALVRGLIYPVPDPDLPFLGVHLSRTVDHHVHAGPNAVLALKREGYRWRDISPRDLSESLSFGGFWKMARTHWRSGTAEIRRSLSRRLFVESIQRLVPDIRPSDVRRGGSGVRAQAVDASGKLLDDFFMLRSPRALHVLNAPSPAATSSLAIGRSIAEDALKQLSA